MTSASLVGVIFQLDATTNNFLSGNKETRNYMAKIKGKSSGDFVWRANSLQEKRKMRKKRNEKKKREWKDKKNKMKRLQDEDVRSAMQNAQTEALRYKRLATKYIAAWRDAIKRNDNKVDIIQFIVKKLEN